MIVEDYFSCWKSSFRRFHIPPPDKRCNNVLCNILKRIVVFFCQATSRK